MDEFYQKISKFCIFQKSLTTVRIFMKHFEEPFKDYMGEICKIIFILILIIC